MWSLWSSENVIGNEIVPWNMQLIKVMKDNYLDQWVMEKAIHLPVIISLLHNGCHFVYTYEQIVWDIEEFDPCEEHK